MVILVPLPGGRWAGGHDLSLSSFEASLFLKEEGMKPWSLPLLLLGKEEHGHRRPLSLPEGKVGRWP